MSAATKATPKKTWVSKPPSPEAVKAHNDYVAALNAAKAYATRTQRFVTVGV